MLTCFHDYLLRTCSLRVVRHLHGRGFERTTPQTLESITGLFIQTNDREALLKEYLLRLHSCQIWQVRLRYIIVLFKVCQSLKLYELVAHTKMKCLTQTMQSSKSRTLLARHLENASVVDRKLSQFIVEPLYSYLLRVGQNQQTYLKFLNHNFQHPLTELFKLCNFLNHLFDLREPCKLVLSNYVNVEIVECLVQMIYEEIEVLYRHLRDMLEETVLEGAVVGADRVLELEILLKEEKTMYQKVCEFVFLFESFTERQTRTPPRKVNLEASKLRKVLQSQQVLGAKKESKSRLSARSLRDSQWILSEYIRHSVYDDEQSILDDEQPEKNTLGKGRKWKQDQSDSDSLGNTSQSLAEHSRSYLRDSLEKEMTDQVDSR